MLRDCIAANQRIDTRLSQTVVSAEAVGEKICVTSTGRDGVTSELFDHVVNALWDGRLAINESFGLRTNRPWLHRLKYV